MSTSKMSSTPDNAFVNVEPTLSPESQRDLDDALDETTTTEDMKRAWVEENVRDLYRAFARGRKSDPSTQDGTVELFRAVEGTENDLRNVLGEIYDKYGELAMYDKGIDNLAHHWVAGYKSIRGQQTVQKVILSVSGTEWTSSCRVLDNLAKMIEAEDPPFPDEDDWTVVGSPAGGVGFRNCRP